jgi:hypothetical protein
MCNNGMESACAAMGPVVMLIVFAAIGCFALIATIIKIFLWWRIFSKTGNSGAFSFLIFVPFGTLIIMCILAFGQWPITKTPPHVPTV